MTQSMTFAALHSAIGEAQARPTVYTALNELITMGYVVDDEPGPRKRKTTLFSAKRTMVLEDMAATLVYLAG